MERKNVSYVVGTTWQPLTPSDLPTLNTKRWVSSRKAQIVVAVESSLLSPDEACSRYTLTVEEFVAGKQQFKLSVRRRFERHVFNITAGAGMSPASNNFSGGHHALHSPIPLNPLTDRNTHHVGGMFRRCGREARRRFVQPALTTSPLVSATNIVTTRWSGRSRNREVSFGNRIRKVVRFERRW